MFLSALLRMRWRVFLKTFNGVTLLTKKKRVTFKRGFTRDLKGANSRFFNLFLIINKFFFMNYIIILNGFGLEINQTRPN